MKHRTRWLLLFSLLSLVAALWLWLRPYQWFPDPASPARIQWCGVTRDHSFRWLDIHLAMREGDTIPEPIELVLADGRTVRPDQVGPYGSSLGLEDPLQPRISELEGIDLRFWLEEQELAGPISLKVGPGRLEVRSDGAPPALEEGEIRRFRSIRW